MRILAVILLIAACAGCQTPRLHTQHELMWLGLAAVGQFADISTTRYALDHGYEEQNRLYGTDDVMYNIWATKIGLVTGTWLLSYAFPNQRIRWYQWLAAGGAGPAGWNMYQLLK